MAPFYFVPIRDSDMTLWLVLALLSAFCLATADAVTKRYLSAYRPDELVLIRFGASGLLLAPILWLQPWPELDPAFWAWMMALIPLEMYAMWLYMQAIRESPLSLTVPYLAFTPVFNTITGYLILGETVSMSGFSGIILVVCGAWLLNLKRAQKGRKMSVLAPLSAIITERGSRLMMATAALYSMTSVIGKAAMGDLSPVFFGAFYFVALGCLTLGLFFVKYRRQTVQTLTRRPTAHLAVGICMGGMVVAHFYAVVHVEVAYMVAVKRLSLLFGILYGAWLFAEPGLAKSLAAASLMLAGVFLIVIGL